MLPSWTSGMCMMEYLPQAVQACQQHIDNAAQATAKRQEFLQACADELGVPLEMDAVAYRHGFPSVMFVEQAQPVHATWYVATCDQQTGTERLQWPKLLKGPCIWVGCRSACFQWVQDQMSAQLVVHLCPSFPLEKPRLTLQVGGCLLHDVCTDRTARRGLLLMLPPHHSRRLWGYGTKSRMHEPDIEDS